MKYGFIGCGNMGGAVARAVCKGAGSGDVLLANRTPAKVQALADDPSMDGAALGKVICDAYYEGCQAVETQDSATLSVTDLTKIQGLLDAYEEFGAQALSAAAQDPGFLSRFSRAAAGTENYGGNTREQGYTNMVDLGGIARHTADTLPGAQAVLDALDECVLYRVNGKYRSEGTGLSCY